MSKRTIIILVVIAVVITAFFLYRKYWTNAPKKELKEAEIKPIIGVKQVSAGSYKPKFQMRGNK